MTAEGSALMSLMTPRSKKEFFEHMEQKQKELSKRQREYTQALTRRLKTRAEIITEQSYARAIERLREERSDIRAQIYVASSQSYAAADRSALQQIGCHIKCQERLSEEIGNLKKIISNLGGEKRRVDKEIYELNLKTIADGQYQEYVAIARKRLVNLQNRLEVKVRRESSMGAENAALRIEIRTLVESRRHFGSMYSKCMLKLHEEQKYLTDLLDYASTTIENGIDMIEKISASRRKNRKENEYVKIKMQSNMRETSALELAHDFSNCKNRERSVAPLLDKELQRRRNHKRLYMKKIGVYNTALGNLFNFTNSLNVGAVIEKFQEQEGLYHSYFAHINRTGYHMRSLETAVGQLYDSVTYLKERLVKNTIAQRQAVEMLTEKLKRRRQRNEALNKKCSDYQKHLERIFSELGIIFNMCQADSRQLFALLGQQNYINIHNVCGYLRKLESRLQQIVSCVYVSERQEMEKPHADCVITDVRKVLEPPTPLDEIVLTQQCPECAEGLVTTDDAGTYNIEISSLSAIRKKLYEDVTQPDMQYRLHRISQCRLPKSRQIVAQRNIN